MTQQPEPATVPAPDRDADEPLPVGRRTHEWPTIAVLLVAAVGLAVVVLVSFRYGTVLLGSSCLLAAVLRLVLPRRLAGLLAVRGRWVDALTALVLGVGLVVLAVSVPLIRR